MTTTKRLVALLAMLLVALGLPTAPALAAPATAQILIQPREGTTDIAGTTWTVTRTATVDPATGAQTAVTEAPVTVAGGTLTDLQQYSVYTFQQATRAPGYLLDTTVYTVEYPVMANGQVAADQSVEVYPKLTPVTGDATLTKYGNDGTTGLPGATFALYRTVDASGATLATPQLVDTLTTNASGQITATALPEGSYYFVETAAPAGYAVDTQTRYSFQVTVTADGTAVAPVPALTAQNYTEPSPSTVSKLVDNAPSTTANVGQQLDYTIAVQIPNDIAEYSTYVLTDVLDSRLDAVSPTPAAPAGTTLAVSGRTVTMTIDPAAVTPGQTVTFTIRTTVNSTATGGDVIPNTAEVQWNNGQGDLGTFVTAAANVTVTEGRLTVTKLDGNTGAALPGATFVLRNVDDTPLVDVDTGQQYTATSGADGTLVFDRIPFGTYELVETSAPANYRLRTQVDTITIDQANSAATATVNNYLATQSVLPATGGWAAVPYYLLGAGLLGLFLVLWRRRRDDEDEQQGHQA